MKKFFIIIGVILVLGIAWLIFSPGPDSEEDTNLDTAQTEEKIIKPWEITVGLYDPADEPDKLTKLLQSRLRELGFKEVILQELVDPAAANQEKTTLLFRSNTEDRLAVVVGKVINSNLYRQGLNEAIVQDVIISAWNIAAIALF